MRRNQRGFTLMELMVVIVIVAILAAVAVPLYINYVKDAQRTEAKGAIGAIVTAEQVYYQRFGTYLDYGDATFQNPPAEQNARLDCDLTEARQNWAFDVTAASPTGFTVVADGRDGRPTADLVVTLVYSRTAGTTWSEQ